MKLILIVLAQLVLLGASADDYESAKREARELLNQQRYPEALDLATKLNRKVPDDLQPYALIADAQIALGNYKEAEQACQWMLDLRPTDVLGMTRAAELRELFGNLSGAIELWRAAYQRTAIGEKAERARILTKIGRLERIGGRKDAAGRLLAQALELQPDFAAARNELGELRMMERKYAEAAETFRLAGNLYGVAEAQEKAGLMEQAARTWAEFERSALAAGNHNRELALYYAGPGKKPAEGLKIARRESSRRKDIYTMSALAKALDAAGDYAEARKAMEAVTSIGVRDPKLLAQAELIESRPR